MAEFRDWIPAGEETGAITENGFQDFVPPKEVIESPQVSLDVESQKEVEETKKGKKK